MAIKHTLLSLVSIAAAGFLLTACSGGSSTHSDQSAPTNAVSATQITPQKPDKTYLFLVSSGTAQLTPLSDHQYELTMSLPSIDQVVAFTDRPYHEAHFMSAQDLQSLWSKGKNSFAKDHPNAVLSSKNVWPTIVELEGVTTSSSEIRITFRPLSQTLPTITQLDKVTLTVDGAKQPITEPASHETTFGGLASNNQTK